MCCNCVADGHQLYQNARKQFDEMNGNVDNLGSCHLHPRRPFSLSPLQLIWPLLRCVGNLLLSGPLGALQPQLNDSRLLAALCAFPQAFLQTHPALARESVWVLNNLTGER